MYSGTEYEEPRQQRFPTVLYQCVARADFKPSSINGSHQCLMPEGNIQGYATEVVVIPAHMSASYSPLVPTNL